MLCPSNLNRWRGTEKRNFSRIRYKQAVNPAKSRFTAIFVAFTWWNGLGDWLINNGECLNNQADAIQQQYGTLNDY